MKKLVFILLTLLFVTSALCAQDNQFSSSKYKFSIAAEETWKLKTNEPGMVCSYINDDEISLIEVRVLTREKKPTADGMAELMSGGVYDGWVRIGGRFGRDNDIFLTGADDKYEAAYKKRKMHEDGSVDNILVFEEYYVKGFKAYFITAKTTEERYPFVRNDIKKIFKSFYIDDNL